MIYVVGPLSFAVAIRYFGVSDPLAAALFLLAFGGRDATRRRRPGLDDGRARQRVQPSRACCAPELERRDRVRRAGGGGLVVFVVPQLLPRRARRLRAVSSLRRGARRVVRTRARPAPRLVLYGNTLFMFFMQLGRSSASVSGIGPSARAWAECRLAMASACCTHALPPSTGFQSPNQSSRMSLSASPYRVA